MEQRVLTTEVEAERIRFKQLAGELKQLVPYRDGCGRLQFRTLNRGERPLNRWTRRRIARRLVAGEPD